jgi:hypothetical protein
MAFLRKFSDVSCAITARLGASDAEDERALARKGSGREWDGSSAQEKCGGDGGGGGDETTLNPMSAISYRTMPGRLRTQTKT